GPYPHGARSAGALPPFPRRRASDLVVVADEGREDATVVVTGTDASLVGAVVVGAAIAAVAGTDAGGSPRGEGSWGRGTSRRACTSALDAPFMASCQRSGNQLLAACANAAAPSAKPTISSSAD